MYTILLTRTINGKRYERQIKTYPFKIQCIIWLYLHGWVSSGTADWNNKEYTFIVPPCCPDAKVEIVKEGNRDR